jgi:glycosyltransferase involved in cell wall biosynthesis
MRILLVCEAFRAFGGVREVVDSLACEFLRMGHHVAVASTNAPYRDERPVRAQVECFAIDVPRWKPLTWRHPERLFKRPDLSALISLIRTWRPDVVNVHGGVWERFPSFIAAGRAGKIPVIISLHGVTFRGAAGSQALAALRNAAAITAISDSVKYHFAAIAAAARDAVVIRNGVDLEAALAARPCERARSYILCVARLYLAEKAIDTLIEAFAELAEAYPQIDLLIAGDGPDRAVVEERIKRSHLEDRVELLGMRSLQTLWGLYKGAMLFVMPSRAEEGLGLVFLEAMAAGLPAIGTRIGGVPEVVIEGQTGLLIEENSSALLAQRMRTLLDDDGLRARMSGAALDSAKQFGWDRAASRYLEVYRRAVSSA